LFARIAYELGRALAPTDHVETMPALALLGRGRTGLALDGPAPASVDSVAFVRDEQLLIAPLRGTPQRASSGDWIVTPTLEEGSGEVVGDHDLGERLRRYLALVEAARLTGAAQALLAYGAAYAREREQFGKIIGSYQGVAHRLARAAGEADAAELLVRKAAFSASPSVGGDGAPAAHLAIMVRAKAIEAARFVATNVHQVFGGNGFAMEYDVQLYSRRIRNWSNRGRRPSAELAQLGRMMLDPALRDALPGMWHYERGLQLPRWAREADSAG
jgi:alkylation response protein AidB-like acyl-CoA dehydrogenase